MSREESSTPSSSLAEAAARIERMAVELPLAEEPAGFVTALESGGDGD